MNTLVIKSHYRLAASANRKLIKVIFQSIISVWHAKRYIIKSQDALVNKRLAYKYFDDLLSSTNNTDIAIPKRNI